MAVDEFGMRIEGLSQWSRLMRDLPDEIVDATVDANKQVGKKIIKFAQARAGGAGRVQAKAARSLRASSSRSSAIIYGGGNRAPYFFGAEFGARQYKQFPAWRGNMRTAGDGGWSGGPGYFLSPAVRDEGQQVIQDYWEKLERRVNYVFPD